ncbi:unnamed protein product [marine sediment metagenome]|uniref:Uncharacterized protein n=1 Tax=marine sediment metagenome TaxID=412755 RepID=X0ST19_9ZZZZ
MSIEEKLKEVQASNYKLSVECQDQKAEIAKLKEVLKHILTAIDYDADSRAHPDWKASIEEVLSVP